MSSRSLPRFLPLALLFLGAHVVSALGAEYRLFERGRPHERYTEIVAGLVEEDVVVFSDGRRFIVRGRLGAGNLNVILDIGEGNVLRIPKGVGEYVNEGGERFDYRDSVRQYLKAAWRLERRGFPSSAWTFAGAMPASASFPGS